MFQCVSSDPLVYCDSKMLLCVRWMVLPITCTYIYLQDVSTLLMMTAREGKIECMNVLLDNGADVDMQDKVSTT